MAKSRITSTGDRRTTSASDVRVQTGTFFDDTRQAIINGLDSGQSEATGWDTVVKATLPVTSVVRTSNTLVTVTLPAEATYNISNAETITATVPASAVAASVLLVATPAITITASGGGSDVSVALTGAVATAASGVLAVARTILLVGSVATGQTGTPVANAPRLTGVSATPAAGIVGTQVGSVVTVGLSGVSATPAVGSVTSSRTVAFGGHSWWQCSVAAVGQVGAYGSVSAIPNLALPLSGVVAGATQGSVVPSGGTAADKTAALTGVARTSAVGTVGLTTSTSLGGGQWWRCAVATVGEAGTLTAVTASGAVLTGVLGTGNVGTVTAADARGLTGVPTTGATGSVAQSRTVALPGVSATGTAGAVTTATTLGVTGVAGPTTVGSVTPSRVLQVTSESGTAAAGSVTASIPGGSSLSGVALISSVGTLSVTMTSTVGLTGVSASSSGGTLGHEDRIDQIGVSGTSAIGTLAVSSTGTAALTGVTAVCAAGTLEPSRALLGSSGQGVVGTPALVVTIPLTGVSAVSVGGLLGAIGPTADVIILVRSDDIVVQIAVDDIEVRVQADDVVVIAD